MVVTEGLLPDSAGPVLSAAAFAPMAAAWVVVGQRLLRPFRGAITTESPLVAA